MMDATGTFQFVVGENEILEFGAIPNRIGDLTCVCVKKRL
jgi:hypothetical protein